MYSSQRLNHTLGIIGISLSLLSTAHGKDEKNFVGSLAVKEGSKTNYSSLAKLSIQDAIRIASQSTKGKVTEAALESENGFLVYEVEIAMADQSRQEVLIDAGDGKVLLSQAKGKKFSEDEDENEDEDKNKDEKK